MENTETGCKVGGDEEKLPNRTKLIDAPILAMVFNCFSLVGLNITVFQYSFHNLYKLRKLRLLGDSFQKDIACFFLSSAIFLAMNSYIQFQVRRHFLT